MTEIQALVDTQAFFRDFSPEERRMLAQGAALRDFATRELICREGAPANRFHLLLSGRVAIQVMTPTRGPVTIETLEPGEILGWSWLVPPHTWRFDVQATEPVRALEFDGPHIREFFERNAAFGYRLLRAFVPLIVDRLQATRLQLLDLYNATD